MNRIIKNSWTQEVIHREHVFDWHGETGWGFCFTVDADGQPTNTNPASRANYAACLTGSVGGKRVVDRGIRESVRTIDHPAIIRCDCGAEVAAHRGSWMGAHSCDACGRLYNSAGQELNPPEMWGEETGETLSDLMTGYDPEEV